MRERDLENTQFFTVETEPETGVKLVLSTVYEALTEKGYNPVNQIVGYIMSGDPTYITSHKSARSPGSTTTPFARSASAMPGASA